MTEVRLQRIEPANGVTTLGNQRNLVSRVEDSSESYKEEGKRGYFLQGWVESEETLLQGVFLKYRNPTPKV